MWFLYSSAENIKTAQAQQKATFDVKGKAPTYDIGDKVLRYNRRRTQPWATSCNHDTMAGPIRYCRDTGPWCVSPAKGRWVRCEANC